MKLLSWNCRGLAHPKTRRSLRALVHKHRPDFIFLCELKTKKIRSISSILSSASLTSQNFVDAIGLAGGICVAWRPEISPAVIIRNDWFFHLHFSSPHSWFLTVIHAPCESHDKATFWNHLISLSYSITDPWLILGDFNAITSQQDKVGGLPFSSSSSDPFHELVNLAGLTDIRFSGNSFTWNNKRPDSHNILQRIDRGMANCSWNLSFPHAHIMHLTAEQSDHTPISLVTDSRSVTGPRPFRFEAMWTLAPSCLETIASAWSAPSSGSPFFTLLKKIKATRGALRCWNHSHFGNCIQNISDTQALISSLQNGLQSSENLAIEESLQLHLDALRSQEETLWRQRAKKHWFKQGDANTRASRKADHFSDVIHKLENHFSGWKSQLLSQSGRTVLIKAVAQSLPVYLMSSHLFPKNLLYRMDKLMRSFWWSSTDSSKPFFLKCWDSICQPKSCGGLGFRRMADFNLALLSKLSWAILTNARKPWVNVFKAKYLRTSDFLDCNVASNASWGWKSICASRAILHKGMCFKIFRFSDVRIWDDPWIPSCSQPLLRDSPIMDSSNVFFVRDLQDSHTGSWNVSLLRNVFPPHLVKHILKIVIPPRWEPRQVFWTPNKSGKFSAKSAYLVDQQNRFSHAVNPLWNLIWNSPMHQRLKLFAWRIAHNILPTRSRLSSLIQISDKMCLFCHSHEESLHHIFLSCPFVERIMFGSKWHLRLQSFHNLTLMEWLLILLDPKNTVLNISSLNWEFATFCFCVMSLIWISRNSILHGSPSFSIRQIIDKAQIQTVSHMQAQAHCQVSARSPPLGCQWSPPPPGWIKVNIDAAFKDGRASIGFLARNHCGSVIGAWTEILLTFDASAAELIAISRAFVLFDQRNWINILFESDSFDAVHLITQGQSAEAWATTEELKIAVNVFALHPSWKIRKIPRLGNKAAHNLAKWADLNDWNGFVNASVVVSNSFCSADFTSALNCNICNATVPSL